LARTAIYMGGHQLFGWTLNPLKQLVSFKWHEFLQRFAGLGPDPSKPLARNISALSTGNWYKMPGKYWSSAVQAVSDFGAEMVGRGADWAFTRRVLAGYLDTYFNDGTTRRDWAREANALGRLFWEEAHLEAWSQGSTHALTAQQVPGKILAALPKHGVEDLITKDWKVLQHLDVRELSNIKAGWLADSHASVLNPTEGRQREHLHFESLPLRRSHTRVSAPTRAAPYLERWPKLTIEGTRAIVLDSKDLLNRVGMDRRVLAALGGWDRLAEHDLGAFMQYWEQEHSSSIQADSFCDWAIMAHYGKHF
jgi:hypothetical protein